MTDPTAQRAAAQDLASMARFCLHLAEEGRATKTNHFVALSDLAQRLVDSGWYVEDTFAFMRTLRLCVTDTVDETLARDLFRTHDALSRWGSLTA